MAIEAGLQNTPLLAPTQQLGTLKMQPGSFLLSWLNGGVGAVKFLFNVNICKQLGLFYQVFVLYCHMLTLILRFL